MSKTKTSETCRLEGASFARKPAHSPAKTTIRAIPARTFMSLLKPSPTTMLALPLKGVRRARDSTRKQTLMSVIHVHQIIFVWRRVSALAESRRHTHSDVQSFLRAETGQSVSSDGLGDIGRP